MLGWTQFAQATVSLAEALRPETTNHFKPTLYRHGAIRRGTFAICSYHNARHYLLQRAVFARHSNDAGQTVNERQRTMQGHAL
jgi:hypothetical protein